MKKYDRWLTEDGLERLAAWARDGLTDEQVAREKCRVDRVTFARWKKSFPQIAEAMRADRELVDIRVENALLKRALGYAYEEVTREADPDSGALEVVRVVTRQEHPDVAAIMKWLHNRRPDRWRDQGDPPAEGGAADVAAAIEEAWASCG